MYKNDANEEMRDQSLFERTWSKLTHKLFLIFCRVASYIVTHTGLCVNAGRVSTTQLVNMIFNFCELYSGKVLFPYQEQFSKRVIRSVLENDGEEITALFSRQSGKSETISVTSGGLMIMLPKLSNMPMFADDPRLTMFKNGLYIGIFAPGLRQAQITYGRIKARIQSNTAQAVMEDPEFNLFFTTSNGQTVSLSNGSFVTAISASDNSNIEGESFMLIICEECFVKGTKVLTSKGEVNIENVKVGDKVYSFNENTGRVELREVVNSFSKPLRGRRLVDITTKSGRKFTCTDNHKIYVPRAKSYIRAEYLQEHDFVLSYKHTNQEGDMLYEREVQSSNTGESSRGREYTVPGQEVFKESKNNSISDLESKTVCRRNLQKDGVSLQYTAENTREFGERVRTLQILNKVLSCCKEVLQSVLQRWKKVRVEKHTRPDDTRSTSLLVHGRRFNERNDVHTYTGVHLSREPNSRYMAKGEFWDYMRNNARQKMGLPVSVLQEGCKEQVSENDTALCGSVYDVQDSNNRRTEEVRDMRERVYPLSGELDNVFSGMSQEEGFTDDAQLLFEDEVVSVKIYEVPEVEVYDITVEGNHNFFAEGTLVHNCQDISNFKIMKSIHPMGAAYNATIVKIGTATTHKGNFYDAIQRNKAKDASRTSHIRTHFEYDCDTAAKYNPKYAKYVEKEKARLGEKSDEFRMSYKLEWIIERGMFVDIEILESNCGEFNNERVSYDRSAVHVAGIDLGGKGDDTWITIVEVDWTMPVILESRVNEDGEEEMYEAYNTYIKDWHVIGNQPDYEEQYPEVCDYLDHWKLARIVCDATREASFSHRLRANRKEEVIPYIFTTKSKSELYKHLDKEISAGRARFCAGEYCRQTREYKMFIEQMGDLEKGYSGQYMVVAHPDERNAHDDACDSWALAVWGTSFKGEANVAESKENQFTKLTQKETVIIRARNRLTARRRR